MNLNIINSFLFHPRKASGQMSNKDILVEVYKGINISLRLHLCNESYPNILFFHGNGEISSEYDDIAKIYNNININFIIADFRGYGFSNGNPSITNLQSDAHIILNFILKYLNKKNYWGSLIIMGRSLGSASVLEISNRYPKDFSALIIESGFSDEKPLFSLIGISANQVGFKKEYGFLNGSKISKYKGPLLIIHAMNDQIVPFEQAEILYKLCPSKNKKLVSISNANHNNILNVGFEKYFKVIENFINH